MGLQQGCDHASWISISKQNKYSPSLLLLLCSSHKLFQLPCRPFSHHDLYLLASSLLGSLSLSSPLLPTAAFFHPLFFCSISPCISSALTLLSVSSFFSLHIYLYITNFLSLRHHGCLHESNFLSLSGRLGGRLGEEVVLVASIKKWRRMRSVLPRGECLISVNGTQESM